jgi:hypothetical protein
MLLGGVAYASERRRRQAGIMNALIKTASSRTVDGSASIQGLFGLIKILEERGGTIVALGTTAASIYTGLQGIVG